MELSLNLPLARKWRPEQFEDVVGQPQVVRVLTQSIIQNRLHHAYLLTGTRGVGKTSLARIFAKALRCPNRVVSPSHSENTPAEMSTIRSCGTCSECQSIAKGQSIDVLEIDGASNNNVETIRELRENAKFLPSSGDKKIFLIDEVHMLSQAAFNAILKTLEEPPSHVLFLFATTEPNKILPTILSRCQKLDLKRVSEDQIQKRLEWICKQEQYVPEDGALYLIARSSDGSLRDSLSNLDQVVAFGGKQFTLKDVELSLGLLDDQKVLDLCKLALEGKTQEAIDRVQSFFESGIDFKILSRKLVELFYELTLAASGLAKPKERSERDWQNLNQISALASMQRLELYFQAALHASDQVLKFSDAKQIISIFAIKIALDSQRELTRSDSSPRLVSVKKNSLSPEVAPALAAATVPAPAVRTIPSAPKAKAPTFLEFVEFVRKKRPMLASLFDKAACDVWPGENKESPWVIAFSNEDYEFYKSQMTSKTALDFILQFTQEFLGYSKKPEILAREKVLSTSAAKEIETKNKIRTAEEDALQHPIVIEAQKVFGVKIQNIQWTESPTEGMTS